MASAIITGLVEKMGFSLESILVFDKSVDQCRKMAEKGIASAEAAAALTSVCDVVFLSVKPQNYEEALESIRSAVTPNTILITIAAGISTDYITAKIGFPCKVVRAMPNTPLMLGKGATALCASGSVTREEFDFASSLFASSGIVEKIPEERMNAVTAVNGSGPAYVYLFAKGAIDHAVKDGIDEEAAKRLFAQTLIGSAEMILESGYSIDKLIEMVSSPGGTTLKALDVFNQREFTQIISDAMAACGKRAEELGR